MEARSALLPSRRTSLAQARPVANVGGVGPSARQSPVCRLRLSAYQLISGLAATALLGNMFYNIVVAPRRCTGRGNKAVHPGRRYDRVRMGHIHLSRVALSGLRGKT